MRYTRQPTVIMATHQSLHSNPTRGQFRFFVLFNPVSLWKIADKGSNYRGVCCTGSLFPKVLILQSMRSFAVAWALQGLSTDLTLYKQVCWFQWDHWHNCVLNQCTANSSDSGKCQCTCLVLLVIKKAPLA